MSERLIDPATLGHLCALGDCANPGEGTAGADFLDAVYAGAAEVIAEWDDDNDPADLQDHAHMTADDAVPSGTFAIWQAFAELAAWNAWDDYVSEYGDGPVSNVHGDGMTARAAIALYWIGNRLAAGLFQEWAEGADDDESDEA